MPVRRGKFIPPTQSEQRAAIGLSSDGKLLDTDAYDRRCHLTSGLRRCFDPSNGEWEDLEPPQPNEWLDCQLDKTPDQSFREYVASRPNRPCSSRKTIYLQPVCAAGENEGPAFPHGPWPSWQVLETAVKIFFSPMIVTTLPAVPMERLRPRPDSRDGPFGKQWHAGQVLDSMIRQGILNDAYGVMAVTMHDLYPKPEWNFVYGLARLRDRVGVFSFVRHTPTGGSVAWREAQMLHRSLKTLLHEIGHMFGLKHCTWYNCLMRGSNGEGVERQLNYLHLCPVCLRKLHWNVGCDIPASYAGLLEIYQRYSQYNEYFARDCQFLERRLQALQDVKPAETSIASDNVSKARSVSQGARTDRVAQKSSKRDVNVVTQSSNSALATGRKSSMGAPKRSAALKDQRNNTKPLDAQNTTPSISFLKSQRHVKGIVGTYFQDVGIHKVSGDQMGNANPTCGCCAAELSEENGPICRLCE
eukprot:gnl/MRDRNA2_/MRDRNA2_109570_c0_seq1.p1 gnl/MRDRNA2_/MRDRNA2_109570_c0~~gnl/MRDRNA2_/MRDRNA2_109570_c0_seq1.p1  ORF type:complete len:472 (+),score=50.07 gnl/MRDRNA2_/MRDRNA2_109570_c0_seq1:106-1521(+)